MNPDDLRWRDLSQHEGPATPPEAYAEPTPCAHDWQPWWDGSLGYTATSCCTLCGEYRPTP